jgi:hypothetical protein
MIICNNATEFCISDGLKSQIFITVGERSVAYGIANEPSHCLEGRTTQKNAVKVPPFRRGHSSIAYRKPLACGYEDLALRAIDDTFLLKTQFFIYGMMNSGIIADNHNFYLLLSGKIESKSIIPF